MSTAKLQNPTIVNLERLQAVTFITAGISGAFLATKYLTTLIGQFKTVGASYLIGKKVDIETVDLVAAIWSGPVFEKIGRVALCVFVVSLAMYFAVVAIKIALLSDQNTDWTLKNSFLFPDRE